MEGKVSSGSKGCFPWISCETKPAGAKVFSVVFLFGLAASTFTCRFSGSVRIVAFRPAKQGIHGGEGIQRLQRSFRWTVCP